MCQFLRSRFVRGSKFLFYSSRRCVGVRVRFAPSPTGFMHIGGLRTALVNKLFAMQQKGTFILRIEDTDMTRYHPEALQDIIRSLQWANLTFDEGPEVGGAYGPYLQSERKSLYMAVANQLIKSDLAYPCFCSTERLELLRSEQRRRQELTRYDNRCRSLTTSEVQKRIQQGQSYTVRFKVPNLKVTVDDLVFGSVEFETQDSDGDFILLKSDGMPVYHLANVVDDHYMSISHVIRGAEWLSSTPKHLLLYHALNWTPPAFAHLPLLLSSTGGKLSKRSPEFALIGQVRSLIRAGYLPSAVLTWLASVGTGSSHDSSTDPGRDFDRWNPHLQMSDLISRFSLDHISRQNVTISTDALRLCGRVHFDRLAAEALDACQHGYPKDHHRSPELITRFKQYLEANIPNYHSHQNSTFEDDLRLSRQLHALQGRVSCLSDLLDANQGLGFLWMPTNLETRLSKIRTTVLPSTSVSAVSQFLTALAEDLDHNSFSSLESDTEKLDNHLTPLIDLHCTQLGLQRPIAMRLIRICLTGREVGPPVVELIRLLSPVQSAECLRKVEKMLYGNINKDTYKRSP